MAEATYPPGGKVSLGTASPSGERRTWNSELLLNNLAASHVVRKMASERFRVTSSQSSQAERHFFLSHRRGSDWPTSWISHCCQDTVLNLTRLVRGRILSASLKEWVEAPPPKRGATVTRTGVWGCLLDKHSCSDHSPPQRWLVEFLVMSLLNH